MSKQLHAGLLLAIACTSLMLCSLAQAEITLQWSDNSNNEDGFTIERAKDNKSFKEIARVGKNVTSYQDKDLVKDQRHYYYRVRAYNNFGYSGYTNICLAEISEIIENALGFLTTTLNRSTKTITSLQQVSSLIKPVLEVAASSTGLGAYHDEINFSYVPVDDDFQLIVKVNAINSNSSAARAGLMVRQSLDTDSKRAAITVGRDGVIHTNWRSTAGSDDSVTNVKNRKKAFYLALIKIENILVLAHSTDGKRWEFDKASTFLLEGEFYVGIAVSSGSLNWSSTADIEIVDMQNIQLLAGPPEPETAFPSKVIGKPKLAGFYDYEPDIGIHSLAVGGNSLSNKEDEIRFTYVPTSGKNQMTVRVVDFDAANSNSRVGFMARNSLEPDSAYAAVSLASAGNTYADWRENDGQNSKRSSIPGSLKSDLFLRMRRTSTGCTAETSPDGFKWSKSLTVPVKLKSEYLAGFFLGSGSQSLSSASLEIVESSEPLLPPSYSDYRDTRKDTPVGLPSSQAKTKWEADTRLYQLESTGKGFENYEDEMTFSSWKGRDKCRIAIKVHSFLPDASWARTGVMLRSSSDPRSACAAVVVNGSGKVEILYRTKNGGKISTKAGPNFPPDGFLALERVGSAITFLWSADGIDWKTAGKVKINLPSTHYVGITLGSDRKTSSALLEVTGLY